MPDQKKQTETTLHQETHRERASESPAPMPSQARRSVELNIEELILSGFSPGDRYRIGESLERELTRLLGEGGLPAPLLDEDGSAHLDGGLFEFTHDATPEAIGIRVARSIYGGFKR